MAILDAIAEAAGEVVEPVAEGLGSLTAPVSQGMEFLGLGAESAFGPTPQDLFGALGQGVRDAVMNSTAGLIPAAAGVLNAAGDLSMREKLLYGGLFAAGAAGAGKAAYGAWRRTRSPLMDIATPSFGQNRTGNGTVPSESFNQLVDLEALLPGIEGRPAKVLAASTNVEMAQSLLKFKTKPEDPQVGLLAGYLDDYAAKSPNPDEAAWDWASFDALDSGGLIVANSGSRKILRSFDRLTSGRNLGPEDWADLSTTIRLTADAIQQAGDQKGDLVKAVIGPGKAVLAFKVDLETLPDNLVGDLIDLPETLAMGLDPNRAYLVHGGTAPSFVAPVTKETAYLARNLTPTVRDTKTGVQFWTEVRPKQVDRWSSLDAAVADSEVPVEVLPREFTPWKSRQEQVVFDWEGATKPPPNAVRIGNVGRTGPSLKLNRLGAWDFTDGNTVSERLQDTSWAVFLEDGDYASMVAMVNPIKAAGYNPIILDATQVGPRAWMVFGIKPEDAARLVPDRTVYTNLGEFSDVKLRTPNPQKLLDAIETNGGFTYDPRSGQFATSGIAVATVDSPELVVPVGEFTADVLDDFFAENAMALSRKGAHIGGWVHDGNVYLDVGEIVTNELTAEQKMKAANQLSAFDLDTGQEIPNPNYVEGGRKQTPVWTLMAKDGSEIEVPFMNLGQQAPGFLRGETGRPARYIMPLPADAEGVASATRDLQHLGGSNLVAYTKHPKVPGLRTASEQYFSDGIATKAVRSKSDVIVPNAVRVQVSPDEYLPPDAPPPLSMTVTVPPPGIIDVDAAGGINAAVDQAVQTGSSKIKGGWGWLDLPEPSTPPVEFPTKSIRRVQDEYVWVDEVDEWLGDAETWDDYADIPLERTAHNNRYTELTQRIGGEWYQAWVNYTGSGYHYINKHLRLGESIGTYEAKQIPALRESFDRFGAPLPPEVGRLFRGIRGTLGSSLTPGMKFRDAGFVSTSSSPVQAKNFAEGLTSSYTTSDQAVLVIEPSEAAWNEVAVLPGNKGEEEWILPAGAVFQVGQITEYVNTKGARLRVIQVTWEGVQP